MLDFIHHQAMLSILVAGLLVAIASPVLGTFLVARRYSLIADSLSHMSLAGISLGLLLGWSPVYVAAPVAALGAVGLEWLRQKRHLSGDIGLAILMSTGLAVAVVLAGLSGSNESGLEDYLFGSLTATSWPDLLWLAVAAMMVLIVVASQYHALMHMVFDEDSARIAGHNVSLLNYTLVAMTAIVVVVSLRIVGGLLISALLVVPVVAAGEWVKSFGQTISLAILFAVAAVLIGLGGAFYFGLSAGGTIVLAAVGILLVSMLLTPSSG